MKLAENIRSLREKQGMSLEDVGRKLSVSRATIMRYEHDIVQNIPYEKIVRMADVFGCTPQHLMGWEEDFKDDNADLVNQIVSDNDLSMHLRKLTELGLEHRRTVYDTIAYWWDKENHTKTESSQ